MRDYELTDRAVLDLAAARDWYDQHGTELGNRFLDAAYEAIRIARERPESCPEIHRGVRGIRCRRFPYRVYFESGPEKIIVLSVYHTARDPQRWNDDRRT